MNARRMGAFLMAALALSGCKGTDAAGDGAPPEPSFMDPAEPVPEEEAPPIDPMAIPPVDDPIVVNSEGEAVDPNALAALGAQGDEGGTPAGVDPAPIAPGDGATATTRLVDVPVERGDSMKAYCDWSGKTEAELLPDGGLVKPKLRAGQSLQLVMAPDVYRRFTDNREKARLQREAEFLQRYDIESLKPHVIGKGDSIWKLAKDNGDVPVWLLRRLNRNVDLEHLKLGDPVLVPTLVEVAKKGQSAGQLAFSDGPEAERARRPTGKPVVANRPVVSDDGGEPSAPVLPRGLAVTIKQGETVRLLSEWSRVPAETIRNLNPQIGRTGMQIGQRVQVPVTDSQLASFVEQRHRFHGETARGPAGGSAESSDRRQGGTASGDIEGRLPVYGANTRLISHKVKRGDTGAKIAKRYGISLKKLKAANPGKRLVRPEVGTTVRVPVPRRSQP